MKNKKRRFKRLYRFVLIFVTCSTYIDVKPAFNIYINNNVVYHKQTNINNNKHSNINIVNNIR